jgi:hypothetical protein
MNSNRIQEAGLRRQHKRGGAKVHLSVFQGAKDSAAYIVVDHIPVAQSIQDFSDKADWPGVFC